MKDAIEKELKGANLQNIDITVTKIIQLYETKNSRWICIHCTYIILCRGMYIAWYTLHTLCVDLHTYTYILYADIITTCVIACEWLWFWSDIHIHVSLNGRHGVMIVGQTGSGKSVTWKMLKRTLTRLHKEKKGPQYQVVRVCGLCGPFCYLVNTFCNMDVPY